jgi:hypothetical protein
MADFLCRLNEKANLIFRKKPLYSGTYTQVWVQGTNPAGHISIGYA